MRNVVVFLIAFVPIAANAACGCEATTVRPCQEETLATAVQTAPLPAGGVDMSACADCGTDNGLAGGIVVALVMLPFVVAAQRAIKRRNPLILPRFGALSGT